MYKGRYMKLILPKSLAAFVFTVLSSQAFAFKVSVPALTLALGPLTNTTTTTTTAPAPSTPAVAAKPATPITKTLYSLDRAQDFQSDVNGEYYVQLGSFRSKANAEKIVKETRAKTNTPVVMKDKGGFYVVTLGPMATAADVRAISEALSVALPRLPAMPPVKVPPPPTPVPPPPVIPEQDNWYVEVTGGAEAPLVDNTITVSNGFEDFLPPPFSSDYLTTRTRWGGVWGIGAGYRWQPNNSTWFPAYSIGVRYRHYYPTNLGDDVSQFSLSEFTNGYHWNVAAEAVMLVGKLNIVQFHQFSPFLNMSAGMAFNRTYHFYEIASADVDPAPQPDFGANHTARFTYTFGAGVDWQVKPKVILSLAYEFQGLGSIYSSTGDFNYSASNLYSKVYQSNNILLSLTYLFGDAPAKA
jgi:opacity protein-like surface antigen